MSSFLALIHHVASSQKRSPGTLQHLIIRGVERRAIFKNDTDRDDFIDRLSVSRALGRVQADPAPKNMSKALLCHLHPEG
jgi:hypothetical protein